MANSRSEHQWLRELILQFSDILNKDARVLEIGAAIENKQLLFNVKEYFKLDVIEGMDIVSVAHEYKGEPNSFDAVCSFSELEHDIYWKKTLRKMYELTRSGGLIFFNCPYNWEEHGTKRTSPEQNPAGKLSKEWAEYYENRTPDDIKKVWNCDKLFSKYYLGLNPYDDGFTSFWGIKI